MTQNMGIGKLGEPGLVFVRKFRFILKGEHFSEWYTRTVKVHWLNSQPVLEVGVYEIMSPEGTVEIHDWARNMDAGKYPNESLTLTTYDGCGNELYRRRFTGLKLLECKSDYDYADSDVVTCNMKLQYSHCYYDEPIPGHNYLTESKPFEVNHLNGKAFMKD